MGQGSYGKVWLAEKDGGIQKYQAAIKHISIPANPSEREELYAQGYVTNHSMVTDYYRDVLETLLVEIQVNDHLKGNTNIVSYEDHHYVPKENGQGYDIFIKMELLTSVFNYWSQRDVTLGDCIQLGIDLCSALAVLEQEHIIHRDIKPGNIFVNKRGDYKLGDFGVARVLEKTTSGLSVKGTFGYMAPEVYLGKDYDYTVDIYSLGLVMYRLLNYNREPFVPLPPQGLTYADTHSGKQKRLQGEPLPRPALADKTLSTIILMACAYEPHKRWRNATAFQTALLHYRNSLPAAQLNQVLLQSAEKFKKEDGEMPVAEEATVNSWDVNAEASVHPQAKDEVDATMFLNESTVFLDTENDPAPVAEVEEPDATMFLNESTVFLDTENDPAPVAEEEPSIAEPLPVHEEPADSIGAPVFVPEPTEFWAEDAPVVTEEEPLPAPEPKVEVAQVPAPKETVKNPKKEAKPPVETKKSAKKPLIFGVLAGLVAVFAVVMMTQFGTSDEPSAPTESAVVKEVVSTEEEPTDTAETVVEEDHATPDSQEAQESPAVEETKTVTTTETTESTPTAEDESEPVQEETLEETETTEEVPEEPVVEPTPADTTTVYRPVVVEEVEEEEEEILEIAVTGLHLSTSSLLLEVGATGFLQATVSPDNATNQQVQWSSSNGGVVQVQGGTVIAYGSGTATITASCSGYSATCDVSVP
ncbi:MAG: protein kinase [Eubacteriales bacterium]